MFLAKYVWNPQIFNKIDSLFYVSLKFSIYYIYKLLFPAIICYICQSFKLEQLWTAVNFQGLGDVKV